MSKRFRVIVAGGGVAGLEAVMALRACGGDVLDVELWCPEPSFTYRALSVREPFGEPAVARFDVAAIVRRAGARLRCATVAAVDPDARVATTADGVTAPYDALLLATGAEARAAVSGARTFAGHADAAPMRVLADAIARGAMRRVAFVVPAGRVWPLPLYELALQTAQKILDPDVAARAELSLVTAEPGALACFGESASAAVAHELDAHGIDLYTGVSAEGVQHRRLVATPDPSLAVDTVIAAPRLEARVPAGVPVERDGFVPVDGRGCVHGFVDLFAAGDMTTAEVKQGGVAAQQADVAAAAIAALAGAGSEPHDVNPVLRGLLLTGGRPLWLRYEPGAAQTSLASRDPLWWPPAKIVGRHLAPLFATLDREREAA